MIIHNSNLVIQPNIIKKYINNNWQLQTKKATKKLAHASPTTSPIKTEMYSPRIAKSSPKKIDMEETNEDAKPSAK